MQPINSTFSLNSNYTRNNNITFQAVSSPIESKFSLKAEWLIRRIDDLLEDTWTAIKKGKLLMDEPKYVTVLKNKDVAVLKPIYNGKKSMLIEISNDKYIENIIIDRTYQSDFTYEKRVITDYGSATLKSYNSKRDNNPQLEKAINAKIEESLSKILPKPSVRRKLRH